MILAWLSGKRSPFSTRRFFWRELQGMLNFDSCLRGDTFLECFRECFGDGCLSGDIAAARLRQRYISKFLL
ncbi:MAG: hypothetical protein QNJ74_23730 [Trichodesmium sp. MO_231.B1]|nr:hypothetical protein [Trichodesmium sp. MO_231.B1]